jgi:hypothetical protein
MHGAQTRRQRVYSDRARTRASQTVSNQELRELNNAGVRAVRFNVKRGGSEEIYHLENMAHRLHELVGWHTELYVDSYRAGRSFESLVSLLAVSIDHLGFYKRVSEKNLNL